MNKDVTICFRTTDKIRKGLESMAGQERRSISSTIELILNEHLKRRRDLADHGEKRRYGRKQVSIPALIKATDTSGLDGGIVKDLSLGGLCLTLPKESGSAIAENGNSVFEAAFVLPEIGRPVRVQCRRERVISNNGDVQIGASFVDADFIHYQHLQQYLV
jgi:hypothetical protein